MIIFCWHKFYLPKAQDNGIDVTLPFTGPTETQCAEETQIYKKKLFRCRHGCCPNTQCVDIQLVGEVFVKFKLNKYFVLFFSPYFEE